MDLQAIFEKFKSISSPAPDTPGITITLFVIYSVLLLIWYSRRRPKIVQADKRLAEVDDEIAEAREKADKNPKSFRLLWDVNNLLHEKFIEVNRQQNDTIFRFALRMIVAGFILICIGLARDFFVPLPANQTVSWVAVIAGLITQFTASTILVIFRSVFRQTMEYYKSVERMSSIGVALTILENLPTGEDAKELRVIKQAEMAVIIMDYHKPQNVTGVPENEQKNS